jgi:hypothetical protein
MKTSGTYLGVNYRRYSWGLECYATVGAFLESRRYIGNGSDKVGVRESVQAFRRDALGLAG